MFRRFLIGIKSHGTFERCSNSPQESAEGAVGRKSTAKREDES
jgi:hypothetical protein